jgi:hypothetical protein
MRKRGFGNFWAGAKVMNMHKKLGFLFCFLTAQTSTDLLLKYDTAENL